MSKLWAYPITLEWIQLAACKETNRRNTKLKTRLKTELRTYKEDNDKNSFRDIRTMFHSVAPSFMHTTRIQKCYLGCTVDVWLSKWSQANNLKSSWAKISLATN